MPNRLPGTVKKGWPIDPVVPLPKGYTLREDTTGAYLYHQGEGPIRTFTHHADPYEIARGAKEHAREKGAQTDD